MKKIIVIGCPGSGKSCFSRALHSRCGIPLYHLDMMFWRSDGTTVEREVFLERLYSAMSGDEWIIDGNYSSTMEARIRECDTVFFLDSPLDVCLNGIKERRGKSRSDMPWIETEEDAEFMEFIKNYNQNQRPHVLSLLGKYGNKNIFIFTSRDEADTFIKNRRPNETDIV